MMSSSEVLCRGHKQNDAVEGTWEEWCVGACDTQSVLAHQFGHRNSNINGNSNREKLDM